MKKRDHSTFLSRLIIDGAAFSVTCSGKGKEKHLGTFCSPEPFQVAVAKYAVAENLTTVNVKLTSGAQSEEFSFSVVVNLDLIAS